jgi:hypothetical protein
MDQPQSGRPARASRPARRSLVEFALPASGALVEMPSAARPLPTVQPTLATPRDKQPIKTSENRRKKIKKIVHEPFNEDQQVAAGDVRQANNLNGAMLEDETKFHQTEDMTPAAANAAKVAKVAEAYRAKAFELMTVNVNTTLEYAQRLVNVKTPTEFVALSASHAYKQLELIINQTTDCAKLATSNVEGITAGFAKTLG